MMNSQATQSAQVEQYNPYLISPHSQMKGYDDNQFSTDIFPDPQSLFEVIDFKYQSNHGSTLIQEEKSVLPNNNNNRKNGLCSTKRQNKLRQQSDKHNFNVFFIRLVKQTIKTYLQNNKDGSYEHRYLHFVLTNIRQTRKSLRKYAIYEENESEVEQEFKIFPTDNQVEPQQGLNIQQCKQYLRGLLAHYEEILINNAYQRQIEREERKSEFGKFVTRIIEQLKGNALRGKDKKQDQKSQS